MHKDPVMDRYLLRQEDPFQYVVDYLSKDLRAYQERYTLCKKKKDYYKQAAQNLFSDLQDEIQERQNREITIEQLQERLEQTEANLEAAMEALQYERIERINRRLSYGSDTDSLLTEINENSI